MPAETTASRTAPDPPLRWRLIRTRWLWSLIAVVILAAPVTSTLRARVPDEDIGFPDVQPGWIDFAVPLEAGGSEDGDTLWRIQLRQGDPTTLLWHGEVWIPFTTYGRPVRLVEARLEVLGTTCTYQTRPGAALSDNQHLIFARGSRCNPLRDVPTGDFVLAVLLADPAPVGIWTRVSPVPVTAPDLITVPGHSVTLDAGISYPVVRGRYVDYTAGAGTTRIDLLNYMWDVSSDAIWIWGLLAVAAGLLVVGAASLSAVPAREVRAGAALVARWSAGTATLALALGILYAVLVPPFQAPDEPDHLLSYAKLVGDTELPADAAAWAQLSHFERIKFHSDERFRPADVDRPFEIAWPSHVHAEDVAARSSTITRLWLALRPVLSGLSVQPSLLTMRLLNAVIFALSVGCATWLVICSADVTYPQLGTAIFLLVPALPFFGMHVSETSLLTAGYVLLSGCLLALFLDGPRSHCLGLPLGLSAALALASGRSAFPMVGAIAAALAARTLLGSKRGDARWRVAAAFWVGWAAGLVTLPLLASTPYRQRLWEVVGESVPAASFTARHWWLVILLSLAAIPLEVGCARVRARLRHRSAPVVASATRILAYVFAAVVALIVMGSTFRDYPVLGWVERPGPPSAVGYVSDVIRTMALSWRFGQQDHLLFSSFWGGFGWLDTIPGPAFLSLFGVLSATSLIAVLWWLASTRDARRLAWLLTLGAGLIVTLALYAFSAYTVGYNVHGRYLMGFHLATLMLAWSAAALVAPFEAWVAGARALRPGVFLLLCGAVHSYAVTFILQRYF